MDELIQDQIMNQLQSGSEVIGHQPTELKDETKQEFTKEESIRKSQNEYNIREMRRKLEESERKIKEMEEQVQASRQQSRMQPIQDSSNDSDEINIGDDDLIEGKHLKKYVNNITRQFERKLEQMNSQASANSADTRLKSQYSDFDSIVSQENLKTLSTIYPEEYNSIMSNPDLYGKAKTAYTMIKNLGISEGQYQDADRRLSENKSRPRAAASVSPQASDTPLARIGDYRRILSEDDKARYRQQVEDAKRYGG